MDSVSKGGSRTCGIVTGVVMALLGAAFAFVLALHLSTRQSCDIQEPLFPKTLKWEAGGEKVELEGSAYNLYVAPDESACFLMPKAVKGSGSALVVAEPRLSEELLEELGGLGAYLYCRDKQTALLRAPKDHDAVPRRQKRESSYDYVPPQGRLSDEDYAKRMQGLALERAEREPRCMDTFIDCGTQVGQVNECFTGLNGIFKMERECLEPTVFQSRMVKPPGRILKILQGQVLKCIEYKRIQNEQGRAVRC